MNDDAREPAAPAAPSPLCASAPLGERVFVVHAGALGDFVLIWPLLRALARAADVTIVADPSRARLAQRFIPGLRALDANQRRFTRLWTGEPADPAHRIPGISRVLSFVADLSSEPGRRWHRSAATMFRGAAVEPIGAVGSASRRELWERLRIDTLGAAPPRANPDGPIIAHIGAGSRTKMWPLDRWADLIAQLRRTSEVQAIAGEAELERFTTDERRLFDRLRGRFLSSLDELADTLFPARLVIGADSGPTHLAAQLGLPTLALFGPTDSALWRPIGPAVRIIDSGPSRSMHAITVERVLRACVPW
jgi:ADP-heptose:LPS heptosyltransferase